VKLKRYAVTVKELSRAGSQVEALLRSDMGFRVDARVPSKARTLAVQRFLERYGEHYYVKACSGQGTSLLLYVVAGRPGARPEPGVVWKRPPATPRGAPRSRR
jgi:hypothetical protein